MENNIDIERIMGNTYKVLTNKCTVEHIINKYSGSWSMFYGNPYDIECADIDEVINFYENTEEYEKCAELLQVKNNIQIEDLLDYNLNTNTSR